MSGFLFDILCGLVGCVLLLLILGGAVIVEWHRQRPHYGVLRALETDERPTELHGDQRPAVSNVVPFRRPPFDWADDGGEPA